MVYAYKLVVAYNGTRYSGWQSQPYAVTVVGTLTDAFIKTFGNHALSIIGASRTDAGVHAVNQVALVKTTLLLDPHRLKAAWSNSLPLDILIRSLENASPDFHPHAGVVRKRYWYNIVTRRPLPHGADFTYFYYKPIEYARLQEGLSLFVGTHDFKHFCVAKEYDATVRTIEAIQIHYNKRYSLYTIEFCAPAFLHFMIRRIVGTVLMYASDKTRSLDALRESLYNVAKKPSCPIIRAPAHGLLLRSIHYQNSTQEHSY